MTLTFQNYEEGGVGYICTLLQDFSRTNLMRITELFSK